MAATVPTGVAHGERASERPYRCRTNVYSRPRRRSPTTLPSSVTDGVKRIVPPALDESPGLAHAGQWASSRTQGSTWSSSTTCARNSSRTSAVNRTSSCVGLGAATTNASPEA